MKAAEQKAQLKYPGMRHFGKLSNGDVRARNNRIRPAHRPCNWSCPNELCKYLMEGYCAFLHTEEDMERVRSSKN